MNITITRWPGDSGTTRTIEDFTLESLRETANSGVAESAQDTANNTAKALGRLLDLLATRRHLDANDVAHIIGTYPETATLTP